MASDCQVSLQSQLEGNLSGCCPGGVAVVFLNHCFLYSGCTVAEGGANTLYLKCHTPFVV